MKQVERLNHYPELYGQTFEDVLDYYNARGEEDFTWGYGKTDRYRVSFTHARCLCMQLDSISYDGDWRPQYTPVYMVQEQIGEEPVHSSYEQERGSVPHDALTIPELVLRSIMHGVQDSIRLRARNGLK